MGSASAEPISFLLAVRHRAPLVLTLDHKTKLNPPRARGGAGSWLPRPRLFFACEDSNLEPSTLRQPRTRGFLPARFSLGFTIRARTFQIYDVSPAALFLRSSFGRFYDRNSVRSTHPLLIDL